MKTIRREPNHELPLSLSAAIRCKNSCSVQGIFSPANLCSSDRYLAISGSLVVPLQYSFHYPPRNWVNLKITREDDRPTGPTVSGNEAGFNFWQIAVSSSSYQIPSPSPFMNECRFLPNGRIFFPRSIRSGFQSVCTHTCRCMCSRLASSRVSGFRDSILEKKKILLDTVCSYLISYISNDIFVGNN